MNWVTMLQTIVSTTLLYSTPFIFTSIGGVFSERGGIVNVGLEGIMTMGAFSSVVFNLFLSKAFGPVWTPWVSILLGALVGAVFAAIHAVACIHFRADHIVSGTVLNLMAPALGVYLLTAFFNKGQMQANETIGYWNFPGLSKIPVIGTIFFAQTTLPGFLALIIAFVSWYILFKTKFGLRLRSVGENPQAADTLGINVYFYRYSGVIISGILGGIGGAIYAQAISGNFSVSTIAGQGFISLAAMIFGKWNPIGAMLASLLFGLSTTLSVVGSQFPVISSIPQSFLQMAPYVVTILVLALFLGKATAPKADGINYIKSK